MTIIDTEFSRVFFSCNLVIVDARAHAEQDYKQLHATSHAEV